MHSEKFLIGSNEVDRYQNLSIPSLFRLLQSIATTGAEAIGAGKKEVTDKGCLWVMTRMEVEIERLPKFMEEITLSTYPGQTLGFFYFRHFFAKDAHGSILFKASSTWALLESATRKIVLKAPFAPIKEEIIEGQLGRPGKLKSLEDLKRNGLREVTYSMCDLNGHLNNVRYLEFIVDAKGKDFYASRQIKTILLNFEKEIQEGEIVSIESKDIDENSFFVCGKVKGEERFLASLSFRREQ